MNGIQIRSDGEHIVVRHLGVVNEGHGGIQALVIRPFAVPQCRVELRVAEAPDTCLPIRRDIGRDDHAERSLDRPAAGEGPVLIGIVVTCRAIGRIRQIAAALDSGEVLP